MYKAESLIDKLSTSYELAFDSMVENAKENLDITQAIYEMERGNYSNVDNLFNLNSTQFKPVIIHAINIAAKEEEAASKNKITLDLDRDTSVREIHRLGVDLITDINSQQRLVIKGVISDGLDNSLSYKTISKNLKDHIGLNRVQSKTLFNIEQDLKQQNVSPFNVKKIIERKTKQMITARAQTIALTESARAVSSGRYLIQNQMVDDAILSKNTMQIWLTATDERTCPVCAPMHEKKVKVGDLFTTGKGLKVISPILHPRCRCIVILYY